MTIEKVWVDDKLEINGNVDFSVGNIDFDGDFAAGAERLDNASLRLKTILETTGGKIPVDKKKIDAIITELETSFEKFKKAEQKFWKEL